MQHTWSCTITPSGPLDKLYILAEYWRSGLNVILMKTNEEWSARGGAGQTARCCRLCWRSSAWSSNRGQDTENVTEPFFTARSGKADKTSPEWTEELRPSVNVRFGALVWNCTNEADVGVCAVTACKWTEINVSLFNYSVRIRCQEPDSQTADVVLSSCELAKKKRQLQYTAHLQLSLLISVIFTRGMKDVFILNKRWRLAFVADLFKYKCSDMESKLKLCVGNYSKLAS